MSKFLYGTGLLLCVICVLSCSRDMSSQKAMENSVTGKYITSGNELEDDMLQLKRNGTFVFFRKNVLVPVIRIESYDGAYEIKGDTILFDWGKADPSSIRDWLSHRCIVDPKMHLIHFVHDLSIAETKTMSRKK